MPGSNHRPAIVAIRSSHDVTRPVSASRSAWDSSSSRSRANRRTRSWNRYRPAALSCSRPRSTSSSRASQASPAGIPPATAASAASKSRPGYHGQPPEHPPGGVCELLVRQLERGGHLQVAGLELIKAALGVRQPGREFGGIPAGPADQPVPGDPQRQGQSLAQLGQAGKCRFPVGGGPVTQDPGQQLGRLRQRQRPQSKSAYALQAGQQSLGGDQRPARARPRQQRAYLLLRPGVVQNDQDAPVPQQRPVQGSARLEITRNLLIRDTERAEQQPQRVTGSHGLRATYRADRGRTPHQESSAAADGRPGRRASSSPCPPSS